MKSLIVDRQDLKHNIKVIKEIAEKNGRNDNHKKLQIIAVVKGNGYGLGLVEYSNSCFNSRRSNKIKKSWNHN